MFALPDQKQTKQAMLLGLLHKSNPTTDIPLESNLCTLLTSLFYE